MVNPLKIRARFLKYIFYRYKTFLARLVQVRLRLYKRLRFRYIRLLVYFGFRLWLKEIHNFEKLPKNGPAIIVSNHTSYYDWAILSSVYNNKYIVFLANKHLLKRQIVGWLMKLNILIYVDKDKPGFKYFRDVIRLLRQGQIVVIYPEGTRSKTGKMIEPKTGFIKLAQITNVPIIPIGMKGAYEILPPHKKIPSLRKCEIFVGDPIFLKEKDLNEEQMRIAAVGIMNIIAKMVGQEWEVPPGFFMEKTRKRYEKDSNI